MTLPRQIPVQVILACWAIFVVYWIAMAGRVKRTKERYSPFMRFGAIIIVVVVIVGSAQLRAHHVIGGTEVLWSYSTPLGVAADVLVVAGVALAIWARNVLGRNWSAAVVFKENHELIQRGPYAYVRHPIYSALLLMLLGTVLVAGRREWLAGVVAGVVLIWIKSRMEERLMTSHFPDAYPAYKRRVKGLIPFVV